VSAGLLGSSTLISPTNELVWGKPVVIVAVELLHDVSRPVSVSPAT
jgi:hypothetical protein